MSEVKDYGSLKVAELKELLKSRELPLNGLKADLVARLQEADAAATDKQPEAVAPNDVAQEDVAMDAPQENSTTNEEVPQSGASTDDVPQTAAQAAADGESLENKATSEILAGFSPSLCVYEDMDVV